VGQCIKGVERSRAGHESTACSKPRNCTSFRHVRTRSTGARVLYSHSYDVAMVTTPVRRWKRRQTWVRNSRLQGCWPSALSPVH